MTFLLDHRPPNLHVVVSTRADPDLPLARLRARGELVEIRARDLRFTVEETAAYLTDVGGLAVAPDDVSALESRTEGWAAALQLAALSMQGRDDVGGFIAGFAGDDRHVVDYLVDEVLSRQSDEVRDFLLRTSVLDPLVRRPVRRRARADRQPGDARGARAGEPVPRPARRPAALVPLPPPVRRRAPGAPAHEQPRASSPACTCARAAGTTTPASRSPPYATRWPRATSTARPTSSRRRCPRCGATGRRPCSAAGSATSPTRSCARARCSPSGSSARSCRATSSATSARRLRDCRAQLPAIEARPRRRRRRAGSREPDRRARPRGARPRAGGGRALPGRDVRSCPATSPATHRHAQPAIDASTADDDLVRAGAAGLSGLAHWAVRRARRRAPPLHRLHRRAAPRGARLRRARLLPHARRHPDGAGPAARRAGELRRRPARSPPDGRAAPPRGVADMHVGLSQLALERGDLADGARRSSTRRARSARSAACRSTPTGSRAVAAMLAEAEGDLAGALELVAEAEQVYLGDFSPERAAAARRRRPAARPAAATSTPRERWARDHGVTATQELSYLREFEHVTLAEVLLARHRRDGDAGSCSTRPTRCLQRLLRAATPAAGSPR